jgi:Domain of unknown function (DU1801).
MTQAPKTQPTEASVDAFIDAAEPPLRRADARVLKQLMDDVTGETAVMWGPSIIGYGRYRATSGDWPIVGFSPRKANLVVYLMDGFEAHDGALSRLGKHKVGASCLYLGKLADVDMQVLRQMITQSVATMRQRHGQG